MHYLAATLHILGATLTDKAEATLADQARTRPQARRRPCP